MTEVIPVVPGDPDPRAFLNSPRGHFIVAKALHYAIKYIGTLPEHERPHSDRCDMVFLLNGCFADLGKVFRWQDLMLETGLPPEDSPEPWDEPA